MRKQLVCEVYNIVVFLRSRINFKKLLPNEN